MMRSLLWFHHFQLLWNEVPNPLGLYTEFFFLVSQTLLRSLPNVLWPQPVTPGFWPARPSWFWGSRRTLDLEAWQRESGLPDLVLPTPGVPRSEPSQPKRFNRGSQPSVSDLLSAYISSKARVLRVRARLGIVRREFGALWSRFITTFNRQ
jgi:hypothetical protein